MWDDKPKEREDNSMNSLEVYIDYLNDTAKNLHEKANTAEAPEAVKKELHYLATQIEASVFQIQEMLKHTNKKETPHD